MRQLKITKNITPRNSNALDKYLQELGAIPLITPEEEAKLARRIKRGDKAALRQLMKANLRFVVSVAKQYQNQGLSLPDLINEGNLGLYKAAKRFDETRGFKFISYAVWWIRQTILSAIADQGRLVRLPLNQVGRISRLNNAEEKFVTTNERNPTLAELTEITELDIDTIKEIQLLATGRGRVISGDDCLDPHDDGSETFFDQLASDYFPSATDNLEDESLKKEFERIFEKMNVREVKVLELYFGINCEGAHSLEEIGEILGLTRERVRQIKEKAIKRIKFRFSGNLKQFGFRKEE